MSDEYKLIISDMDGTVVDHAADAMPSSRVCAAIKLCVDGGGLFAIATGRPYELVKPVVEHLGVQAYCICDNGAVIIDSLTDKAIWEATLDSTIIEETQRLLGTDTNLSISYASDGNSIRKIGIFGISLEEATQLKSELSSKLKDVVIAFATSHTPNAIDLYISNENATKAHAAKELQQLLLVQASESIGIGDSFNDQPLLEACGLAIAMGNAIPEIKAMADVVVPSLEEDGLAYTIETYLLNT